MLSIGWFGDMEWFPPVGLEFMSVAVLEDVLQFREVFSCLGNLVVGGFKLLQGYHCIYCKFDSVFQICLVIRWLVVFNGDGGYGIWVGLVVGVGGWVVGWSWS